MDFSTLQSRVLTRLNMDTTDPAAPAVGDLVNEAIHDIETATSDGWPWMRQTVDLTLTSGTGSYTFAAIAALTVNPVASVGKVLSAKVLRQSSYYDPLKLLSVEESAYNYPTTNSGIPESFWVEGQKLYIYPTPDGAYSVRLRVVCYEPDLTSSTSSPVMPSVYHSAIVDTTVALYYMTLQDVAKMQAAQQRADRWIDRLKRNSPEYKSAPRVAVRDWLY